MFVNSIVFTHVTIEGPLLQVNCGHMPLKGKLVSCGILANRTLVSDLAGSLVSVSNVSFQGRFVHCVVVAYVAGKYQLRPLFVEFSNVSFQC